MMDLHGQIINVQIEDHKMKNAIESAQECNHNFENQLIHAYKIGHCDARHAAAELASTPDQTASIAQIAKLFGVCDNGNYFADWETIAEKYSRQTARIAELEEWYREHVKAISDHAMRRVIAEARAEKSEAQIVELEEEVKSLDTVQGLTYKRAQFAEARAEKSEATSKEQTSRIAELDELLEGMKVMYMEQRVRAEKSEAEVERLLEALTPCDEAIFDYINALEAQGWTRHKDAEIADAQALLEKVKTALAVTGKEQK